ncbi:MAG: type II toxin-antitoxin system VapC family toxin [Terriglobales bacterium]
MILADTSVWIELLRRPGSLPSAVLRSLAVCGPVLQEVMQGLRPGRERERFVTDFSALPVLSDPLPRALFLDAAAIYRRGRERGVTIRSSVDCLIAAIAVANGVPLWHRDQDFDAIATLVPLRVLHTRLR